MYSRTTQASRQALDTKWGEPVNPDIVKGLAEMSRKRAMDLQEEIESDFLRPLNPAELTPASERFRNPPPPRKYLIKDILPANHARVCFSYREKNLTFGSDPKIQGALLGL